MNAKHIRIVIVAAVVGMGVWAFYAMSFWASRGGQSAPLYSVRRFDPYGTAALFELLQHQGVEVHTLERSRPDTTVRGLIIQVLPVPGSDPSPQLGTEHLKQWIMIGNTVIQFTAARTALMDACGVPQPPVDDSDLIGEWSAIERGMNRGISPQNLQGEIVHARLLTGATERIGKTHGERLALRLPTALPLKATSTWQPIAAYHPDVAAAGIQRVGLGQLVVVASPSAALNTTLGRQSNLDFILAVIGQGPVWFDEWSHGIGTQGTVIGIMKSMGLIPVIVQVAFVIALYHWSTLGHRHHSEQCVGRRRSSVEQVVTLGYLYHQSMSTSEIKRRARQEILHRIALALRCAPADIDRQLASLHPPEMADRIRDLLARLPQPVRPDDPHCPRCGYNLLGSRGDACPDCGAAVAGNLRRRLATESQHPAQRANRPDTSHAESHAARLLTLSHQLARELNRERHQRIGADRSTRAAGRLV